MTPDEFWQILHDVRPAADIFYRLYYDGSGRPICYSMEDLPGNYIDIDQDAYARSSKWVRVRDGRLEDWRPWLHPTKLVPGSVGTACVPWDVMLVSIKGTQQWSMKRYDQD
jgi:hypothetical protein